MLKKAYYAHWIFSYNTPFEVKVLDSISKVFPGAEIVNPRDYRGVDHGGKMDFFHSLIDSCDAIVYSEVLPGYLSAERYKGYEYRLTTYLDSTFNFLLKRPVEEYWKWTNRAIKSHFWYYLAGFVDADGHIGITEDGIRIMLHNKDKELLKLIRGRLQGFGLHPTRLWKDDKGYHYVVICRKQEVIEVLRRLPLKHPEKFAVKHLILSRKFTEQEKLQLYRKYRKHIKREVSEYVKKAEKEYIEQHSE